MSFIAGAIIGGAVLGAYSSRSAAKEGRQAVTTAAGQSTDATIRATQMQIAEIGRQFDYQQQLLAPFIARQQQAGQASAQLLGYANQPSSVPTPGPAPGGGSQAGKILPPGQVYGGGSPSNYFAQPGAAQAQPQGGVPVPGMGAGPGGSFVDPNINATPLGAPTAQGSELGQHAFQNVLAPRDPAQDLMLRRAADVSLATPGGYGMDPRFQFAQETATVGADFESSPGYEFQLEQGLRAADMRLSRGGANYGGRAVKEASRYATGLAQQDYYNWLGARRADLGRQDQAIAAYQGLQTADVGRGDAATQNYLSRMGIDLGRQDAAIRTNYQRQQYDLQRQDQGYYNYLGALGGASGINVGVPQAVGASGSAGAQAAQAYGAQGGNLAAIYGGLGENLAGINMGQYQAYNNIGQQTIGNYLYANQAGMFAPPPPPQQYQV